MDLLEDLKMLQEFYKFWYICDLQKIFINYLKSHETI